jgi:DNA polymerase-3 subunit alpha
MLAAEKESIGLFISTHPLKEIRPALAEKVDVPLAGLPERKDQEWVTAGGIITQARRIRTKKGDPMMFATIDDLEGSVEVVIFAKALEAYGDGLDCDAIVLVRGRVDHKEPGKTCLVADKVEKFEPTEAEVVAARAASAKAAEPPKPLRLALDAAALPHTILEDLKGVFSGFPGEADVVLDLRMSAGQGRRLKLGPDFRVTPGPGLRAELHALLGPALGAEAAAA